MNLSIVSGENFSRTNPLSLGILQIGVGKKKIRFLEDSVCFKILDEVSNLSIIIDEKHIQFFAFLGAFLIKEEYSKQEDLLLKNFCTLFTKKLETPVLDKYEGNYKQVLLFSVATFYCPLLFETYQSFFMFLLKGIPLDSNRLQSFVKDVLYKTQINTSNVTHQKQTFLARAFFMSNIRYRYTSIKEYEVLYDSLTDSFLKEHSFLFSNTQELSNRSNIILSEPFDGINRTHLITPLIAKSLFYQGFMPLQLVGDSSGPKFICNLLDILKELKSEESVKKLKDFTNTTKQLYINLSEYSTVLKEWRFIRGLTLKRPFLSTIEKFPRLFQSEWFISSAFHENYTDIMLSLAEHAGYSQIILIKNGREGTLSFSLSKPVEIFVSKRKNSEYVRDTFLFSLMDCDEELESDGRCAVSIKENVLFIEKLYKAYKIYLPDLSFSEKKDVLANLDLSEDEYKSGLRFLLTQAGINKALCYLSDL